MGGRVRRHQRLGDLVGSSLLAGGDVRLMVNRSGEDVQLVRMGPDFRAQVEVVPADDRDDVQGWIRTAERRWQLRGLDWRFESVQESWSAWPKTERPEDTLQQRRQE